MEELIIEEMNKNLKWYDRVVVRVFKNTFIRVCNIIRVEIVNKLLE